MDDLNLAVASKSLRVGRQASGVPAVVAWELAGQIRRRVIREGTCSKYVPTAQQKGQTGSERTRRHCNGAL
eukprot:361782-Chlamydomonas_euryale.AAC.3